MTAEQLGFLVLGLITIFTFLGYIFKAYKMTEEPYKEHERRITDLETKYERTISKLDNVVEELKRSTSAIEKLTEKIGNHETRLSILEHKE